MKTANRCQAVLFLVFLLLLPAAADAANLHLQSDTLFRFFERDTSTKDDVFVAPAYEYLQADVGALRSKGLSFHLYGWGRADLGDRDFFDDDTAGELLYGYLQYRQPFSNFDLKLGRQYVFEGVANEAVDGLRLGSDLGPYFGVSLYGGQPAALDSEQGRSGDSIYGGRLAHRLATHYELGVSYKSIDNDSSQAEEMLGLDIYLGLPAGISLYGFSSRNLDSEGWAEHSYELPFRVGSVDFRPYYQRFNYDDYFTDGANSANPFRFLAGTGETLTVFGGDIVWRFSEAWDLGLKAKAYDYDELDGSAEFFSGLATWHGEGLTSAGAELGVMNGDEDKTRYLLVRAFFYLDGVGEMLPRGFVTGDVVYAGYDEEIDTTGEDTSLFLSLGAGHRFLDDALALKLSADYSSDPFFDNDLRGLAVVSYTFDR